MFSFAEHDDLSMHIVNHEGFFFFSDILIIEVIIVQLDTYYVGTEPTHLATSDPMYSCML